MVSAILRTDKLCKSFSNGGRQQHVIKNMDLEIMENDFTIIMGASGSGKSTLLYALSGMDKPSVGKIYFADKEIQDYSNDELAVFRRGNCGFVFQSVYLLENQTVLDNVLTGALIVQKNSPKLVQKAKDLLIRVGIKEEMWNKYPNQLSGGEAQRVGIVRAIINDPKILFADEPTGALNSASSKDVLDIFTELHKNGQTIVMVTHDLKTALRGNRVIFLRDGKVEGDYRMPDFGEDNLKERRDKLSQFLEMMGW
ncbi:MAG: ABC transporter ATP-binding protein [Acutalibacteraceae bacterium]|nr:ABC transporter ATP-binding protein [Acutalibacteraceae bacterium]